MEAGPRLVGSRRAQGYPGIPVCHRHTCHAHLRPPDSSSHRNLPVLSPVPDNPTHPHTLPCSSPSCCSQGNGSTPLPSERVQPILQDLPAGPHAGPSKDEVMEVIQQTLQELVGLQVQPMQPLMDAGLDLTRCSRAALRPQLTLLAGPPCHAHLRLPIR